MQCLASNWAQEIQNISEEMGHKQPPAPIQPDNSMAKGIINSWGQPKWTKAIDMGFHWLHDWGINQNQFRFYWHPGALQQGNYWTKHHPPTHHHKMRSEILTPDKWCWISMKGCRKWATHINRLLWNVPPHKISSSSVKKLVTRDPLWGCVRLRI